MRRIDRGVAGRPGEGLVAEKRQLLPVWRCLRRRSLAWIGRKPALVAGRDLKLLRKELDRAYLTRFFRDTAGDIGKMAAALEVKASRLYAWLRETGIDIKSLRRELSGY